MKEEKNKGGRPLEYTPEEFQKVAEEYFKYAKENPRKIEVPAKNGPASIHKPYPVNIYDFCKYADIHRDTFYQYKNRKEFTDTCAFIDTNIKAAQFSGAITGEFNSNFVARINDLAEKKEVQINTYEIEF